MTDLANEETRELLEAAFLRGLKGNPPPEPVEEEPEE